MPKKKKVRKQKRKSEGMHKMPNGHMMSDAEMKRMKRRK